jgi:predicted DsbA family dithiol-disulfide isomerase
MKKSLKIDFISDVSCGWCAVGLKSLEQALQNVASDVEVDLNFQPFELNPTMPAGGQNLEEHLIYKYGTTGCEQYISGTRERGADVGFEFKFGSQSRIYNTFDAHRLLHWAGLKGRQLELKHALFNAHFTENKDPNDHQVLLKCAHKAGLNTEEAKNILLSKTYEKDVRMMEEIWKNKGVHAVPTIVINDKYAVTGSRSVATFEELIQSAITIIEK